MKLGISAFAWTAEFDESYLKLLPWIREQGITCFEIPVRRPSSLNAPAIRTAFRANDLECSLCALLPEGINPISPDVSVRRISLIHLIHCIEVASELGARILGGPIYSPIGYLPNHRPTRDEWGWAIEMCQELGSILDAHEITLCIEPVNRSETFFLRSAEDARAFCATVNHPRVGVTLDSFHSNIEDKDIVTAVRTLGPYLRHVHVSENDRGILGSGHVDFPAMLLALSQIGYEGYLMIEGFGYTPEDVQAPGYLLAEQSVSPERLTSESIAYLRKVLQF